LAPDDRATREAKTSRVPESEAMPRERMPDREVMPGAAPVIAIVRDVVAHAGPIIEVSGAGGSKWDCRRAKDRDRG